MAKKSSKGIYVAALILFVGGLSWLLFSGLSEDSVYFLKVSEALAMDPAELSQARLFGTVDAEGLEGGPGTMGARFRLLDSEHPGAAMWVEYKGAVPDTFKPGMEVIVEGGYTPAEGRFNAATLMTKCPSKYEKEQDKS
jgi:cytochrome c-type biogenesis protein CcmE